MPIVGNSPWMDAANTGQGLSQGLGQAMMQVPRSRAEAALMRQTLLQQQQQMALAQQAAPLQRSALAAKAAQSGAQGNMYQARAGVYNQQSAGMAQDQKAELDLGSAAATAVQESVRTGQMSPESASKLAQAMFTASKVNPKLMEQFGQLVGLGQQHLQQNPGMANALATGAHVQPNMSLGKDATMVDTATGQPKAVGMGMVPPGNEVTMPQQIPEPTYNGFTGQQNPQPSRLTVAATNQMPQRPSARGGDLNAQRKRAIADLAIKSSSDPSFNMEGSMSNLNRYLPESQMDMQSGGQTNSPAAPRVIQDPQTGFHWKYKGNMPDPTKDSNPQNWEKVQ